MGRSCFSRHMRVDSATRAFLIHAVVYIAVIALCAALALSHSPPRQWFLWVAAGWGIGLGAHGLAVWLSETRHRARIFADPRVRGFAIHAFVYLAVVALLFGVNIAAGKHHWWGAWVALGWGIGVAAHGWALLRNRRPATGSSTSRGEP